MLEAEVPFVGDLDGILTPCEGSIRATVHGILLRCKDELELLGRWVDPTLLDRLNSLISPERYARVTYTEAICILKEAQAHRSFEHPVEWGLGLQSEHERYLAEEHIQGPVFITDYPETIKPFYMRKNPMNPRVPGETVACFDLLVPGIGELVGGSVREEREEVLVQSMRHAGLDPEGTYAWYVQGRQWGGTPHAGWGMGIERLILLLTGMPSVKDTLPYPRWTGTCRA